MVELRFKGKRELGGENDELCQSYCTKSVESDFMLNMSVGI